MALPADVLARRDRLPKKPAPVTLTGSKVELRPLTDHDFEPLHAVSNGQPFTLGDRRVSAYDTDEVIWKYMRGSAFEGAAALGVYLSALAVKGRSRDTAWLRMLDSEWRAREAR
jgi:hypothetical protein